MQLIILLCLFNEFLNCFFLYYRLDCGSYLFLFTFHLVSSTSRINGKTLAGFLPTVLRKQLEYLFMIVKSLLFIDSITCTLRFTTLHGIYSVVIVISSPESYLLVYSISISFVLDMVDELITFNTFVILLHWSYYTDRNYWGTQLHSPLHFLRCFLAGRT